MPDSELAIMQEIIARLVDRIDRLEELILCQHCNGTGKRTNPFSVKVKIPCTLCSGVGNRLDDLEQRICDVE